MLHAPDSKIARKAARPAHAEQERSPIVSLAAARLRRRARQKQIDKPLPPELTGLDLRGVDLERMTESGRQHYWFNLNRYARRLYTVAGELSETEHNLPAAPVTAEHVRAAELRGMPSARRSQSSDLGFSFVLDALQILCAALCGALATKPDLVGEAGVVPLSIALVATISVFLAREAVAARTR
jgi:hypothetical protein